jgi:hypothetical protein
MRYAQIKGGQKLHIVYKLHEGLTTPVCGRKVENGYRMTINVPLGNSCKNCLRKLNSNSFNVNGFIKKHL